MNTGSEMFEGTSCSTKVQCQGAHECLRENINKDFFDYNVNPINKTVPGIQV